MGANLLKNGKREIIELREVNPFEVIVLPSNRLIFADTINKCFTILNQNFNLIKKIDRINDTISMIDDIKHIPGREQIRLFNYNWTNHC